MRLKKGDVIYRDCKLGHKFRILKEDMDLDDTWQHLPADAIMAKFDALIAELKHDWRDDLKRGDWVETTIGIRRVKKRNDVHKHIWNFSHAYHDGEIKETPWLCEDQENIRSRWTPPECPELPLDFKWRRDKIVYSGIEATPLAWLDFAQAGEWVATSRLKDIVDWQDTWGKLK